MICLRPACHELTERFAYGRVSPGERGGRKSCESPIVLRPDFEQLSAPDAAIRPKPGSVEDQGQTCFTAMLGQAGEVSAQPWPGIPAASSWRSLPAGQKLGTVEGIFARIDDATVAAEIEALSKRVSS